MFHAFAKLLLKMSGKELRVKRATVNKNMVTLSMGKRREDEVMEYTGPSGEAWSRLWEDINTRILGDLGSGDARLKQLIAKLDST